MPVSDAQEEAIFLAALEKGSPEERVRYLVDACGGDTELRGRVEHLLDAHFKSGRLDAPVIATSFDPPILLTPPGTVIGRYKLLEPIGEGGYGTVFMAEQTSPVQRRVALKIIKAGTDTREGIAHFQAARPAPALRDPPDNPRVFGAGPAHPGPAHLAGGLGRGRA